MFETIGIGLTDLKRKISENEELDEFLSFINADSDDEAMLDDEDEELASFMDDEDDYF